MRKLLVLLCLGIIVLPVIAQTETSFTVEITNVSGIPIFENMGVADTPIGSENPAPILPGESYEITFPAFMAEGFSFVTMLAESNDLFIGTIETGISLYDEDGNAPNGDITEQFFVLDLGTEVNEPFGIGANQALRQAAPNTGESENAVVRAVEELNDGFSYPSVTDIIRVHIEQADNSGFGDGDFTVLVENVSGDSEFPTALTPIVWVLHFPPAAFFQRGEVDYGHGLEQLAEDGNPQPLATTIGGTAFTTPITPIGWAVHTTPDLLFIEGQADRGEGLEQLAEDGNVSGVAQKLAGFQSGIASVPIGTGERGVALPEQTYSFTFTASEGDYVSFATMLAESNDLFIAPNSSGIALYDEASVPISGDITKQVFVWDLGTEVNEPIGEGANQAPRQSAPNTGEAENGAVSRYLNLSASAIVTVTITPN